jgi:hypothetical protein
MTWTAVREVKRHRGRSVGRLVQHTNRVIVDGFKLIFGTHSLNVTFFSHAAGVWVPRPLIQYSSMHGQP